MSGAGDVSPAVFLNGGVGRGLRLFRGDPGVLGGVLKLEKVPEIKESPTGGLHSMPRPARFLALAGSVNLKARSVLKSPM